MSWQIESAQDEAVWLDEYVDIVLSAKAPSLPANVQELGPVKMSWEEVDPGEIFIITKGGSIDDRFLCEQILTTQLAHFGYERVRFDIDKMSGLAPQQHESLAGGTVSATFTVDDQTRSVLIEEWTSLARGEGNTERALGELRQRHPGYRIVACDATTLDAVEYWKAMAAKGLVDEVTDERGERIASLRTADWNAIQDKAKRLIQSGQVTLLRNGSNIIAAHVVGDHGEYDVEISRDDPNSRVITQWTCECAWDQFAFQRTRQWKKLEGRPCAHVLAAYWTSLGTPLDDAPPGAAAPAAPGAPAPPAPPGGAPEPAGTVGPPLPSPTAPEAPLAPPVGPALEGPQDAGILPPFPGAIPPPPYQPGTAPPGMAPPNAVSVPGARPLTPAAPVQTPGTYSKLAAQQFTNGQIVRLLKDDYAVAEGRDGATDAGQYMLIKAGREGEVLGQDPSTGYVEVIFPLKGGPMTSYHARCFCSPGDIEASDTLQPGPMVKRR